MITRRRFLTGSSAGVAMAVAEGCRVVSGGGCGFGPRCSWVRGHFQIHQIYTGRCESYFMIFPDGTTMLLDCGESNPHKMEVEKWGDRSLPILPDEERGSGEWIARYVERVNPNGADVDYMMLSHFHADHVLGFPKASETLHFRHAIDRGWPDYNDPLPYPNHPQWMSGALTETRELYAELAVRDGLTVEKFLVGARNQIRLLRDPDAYPDFSTFNLCGNGKVAMKDGSVVDCYSEEHPLHRTCVYNENAMSIGGVFTYGKFRYYSAGDFTASDGREGSYRGKRQNIEKILALGCEPVTVAKANHHAAWSTPIELVEALRPRAWLASVWWQLQCDEGTMSRLASRTAYPNDRLLLPGVMCAERRKEDSGRPYLAFVPDAVHSPSHIVIDVPPGGATFTIACHDPAGESCRLKKAWDFRS